MDFKDFARGLLYLRILSGLSTRTQRAHEYSEPMGKCIIDRIQEKVLSIFENIQIQEISVNNWRKFSQNSAEVHWNSLKIFEESKYQEYSWKLYKISKASEKISNLFVY